jgi:protein ImuA
MLHDLRQTAAPADPLTLAPHRMHEAGGRGRRAFAQFQAARHPGLVVWIVPDHIPERPMLAGLPQGLGERLILLAPKGQTDLLWCVEETLRAAPVGLVIAEPQDALSLTEGRRLQLAAEAGRTTALLLIREGAGCNATESRWQCDPESGPEDSTLHHWSLNKNKRGTCSAWVVNWNGASAAFHLVSKTGERRKPAQTPG